MTDQEVLRLVEAAFADVPRPEHFTNFTHCEECAEHDELLRSRDCSNLNVSDVGNPGWDPLCFSSGQGIAYFMPALARLALAPPTYDFGWYGSQLLFHLGREERTNQLFAFCNAEQRAAVLALLRQYSQNQPEEAACHQEEIDRARSLWGEA